MNSLRYIHAADLHIAASATGLATSRPLAALSTSGLTVALFVTLRSVVALWFTAL